MSADLLARLIEAGTPASLVGEVAMALASAQAAAEAQVQAALAPSAGALRTRRWRERHATSQGVTCDAGDGTVTDCVTEAPSPDKSPQTPKINPTPRSCGGDAPTRKAGKFPVPDGCSPDDWRDLLANRKSKRLPMTEAAYRKLLRDLAEQADDEWPPGRVLAHAAERGWAAIFDPRESQGPRRNGNRPRHHDRSEPQNPMVRAVIKAEAREARDRGAGVQPRLLS